MGHSQEQARIGRLRLNTNQLVWIATLMVVVWYPFNHIYLYHVITGNIPDIIRGVLRILVLLFSVAFGFFMLNQLSRRKLPILSIVIMGIFTTFVALIILWIVAHYLLAEGPKGSMLVFEYYSRALFLYFFLFLAGIYMRPQVCNSIWLAFFVLIFINSIIYYDSNNMMIDLSCVIDKAYSGMYLSLSDTAMFSGFIAWSVAKKPITRVACLCLLGVVLFITGSRANFIGYLMVLPVALSFTLRRSTQIVFYCVIVLGAAIAFSLLGGWEMLAGSRYIRLLSISEDPSWIARQDFLFMGINDIMQNPVFGNYDEQFEYRGTIGPYIHNWLSVWQAFGIIPFLLYTSLVFIGIYQAARTFWLSGRSAACQDQLIAVFCLLATVLVLAAKSMGWVHISLVWGMLTAKFLNSGSSNNLKRIPRKGVTSKEIMRVVNDCAK
jgi:hypothetical protein